MKNISDKSFLDFSQPLGGTVKALYSMSLSGDMKDEANREAFLNKHFGGAKFIFGSQVHKTKVVFADLQTPVPAGEADGLVTNDRNVVLGIFTADCLPVFLNDPVSGYAGIIHAGWRGVSSNIIISAMDGIRKNYPVDLTSLKVAVGPGICAGHFEVSAELAHVFPEIFVKRKKDKYFADLKKIIKTQLADSGVRKDNIYDSKICSFEEKNIFSYRRDRTSSRNCAFLKIL